MDRMKIFNDLVKYLKGKENQRNVAEEWNQVGDGSLRTDSDSFDADDCGAHEVKSISPCIKILKQGGSPSPK